MNFAPRRLTPDELLEEKQRADAEWREYYAKQSPQPEIALDQRPRGYQKAVNMFLKGWQDRTYIKTHLIQFSGLTPESAETAISMAERDLKR
jgi:hypothetical protein